jgi:hypothetical protein
MNHYTAASSIRVNQNKPTFIGGETKLTACWFHHWYTNLELSPGMQLSRGARLKK